MSVESKRITFEDREGQALAGRLEMPAVPRAWAIFAHCFSCTKQSKAAVEISRALAKRGIATLRFDFTGLGESEGEFGKTTFASSVQDIVAAADFLRTEHGAPAILVGHSFGGTAALAAAGRIESVKAVATIAAPFSPDHLAGHFSKDLAAIRAGEKAEVDIGGRQLAVNEHFLKDVSDVDMSAAVEDLGKALLVMHGPLDRVVGIDEASRIFQAAKHPKSFISLDNANHLLTDDTDARYAADVLTAWAARYVTFETEEAAAPEGWVTVTERGTGKFVQDIVSGPHRLTADEPVESGGDDQGPGPYELLLSGLGACTSMTLRLYADHKKWPLERVAVALKHEKKHRDDCDDCSEQERKMDYIRREITITGDLDEEQRQRLVEVADKCPVHRTLQSEIVIDTTLAE